MVSEGRAAWIRFPTHPTLSENRMIVESSNAKFVLGHSCEPGMLARLATHVAGLRADIATGAHIDV
jgi:hypothetical protein